MDQGLDAALDTKPSAFLWALGGFSTLTVAVIVQAKTPLHHLVVMALCVITVDAKIKVLQKKESVETAVP